MSVMIAQSKCWKMVGSDENSLSLSKLMGLDCNSIIFLFIFSPLNFYSWYGKFKKYQLTIRTKCWEMFGSDENYLSLSKLAIRFGIVIWDWQYVCGQITKINNSLRCASSWCEPSYSICAWSHYRIPRTYAAWLLCAPTCGRQDGAFGEIVNYNVHKRRDDRPK